MITKLSATTSILLCEEANSRICGRVPRVVVATSPSVHPLHPRTLSRVGAGRVSGRWTDTVHRVRRDRMPGTCQPPLIQ